MEEYLTWDIKPEKLTNEIEIANSNFKNPVKIQYEILQEGGLSLLYWKFDHIDETYDISYSLLENNNISLETYFTNSINIIYDQINSILLNSNEEYLNNINSNDLEFLKSFKNLLK